ncbi:MAG: hypothetical protein WKF81_08255, partial [Thermomicrobiales bacterium]
MTTSPKSGPFSGLFEQYTRGDLSRRRFIGAATALGMSVSMARFCADAAAQSATPGATPAGTPVATPAASMLKPSAGTENQTRGEGGELRILQWQAPSSMNAQTATGDKDGLASLFVSEPLLL